MKSFGHFLGAIFFCVFCTVLFFQLGHYSLDSDQALSLYFAGGKGELFYSDVVYQETPLEVSLDELKEYVRPSLLDDPRGTFQVLAKSGETHPPLYYEGLRLWMALAPGIPLQWARFLSLTFTVLSCALVGLWSRDLTKKNIFFWVGSLFFLSSYHVIEQSGVIRMHSMTLFFMALFTWSSYRLLKRESRSSLVFHHLSLLCGLLSTFFFAIYALPFVLYRLSTSRSIVKEAGVYLLTQSGFLFWLLIYGRVQLLNLPYEDFSGLSHQARGLALQGWSFEAYSDLFLYLTPFYFFPYNLIPPFWFVYAIILAVFLWLYKEQRQASFLFFLMPLCIVVVGEFVLDSVASQWASGRAVNFLLLPLLMFTILILNKIENRIKHLGFFFALVVTGLGFSLNYQTHQNFLLGTPELIDEKALEKVKEREVKDDDLVILLNPWGPHILRTTLHFKNYSEADAFIFESLSDLAHLKLDQYREILVISNSSMLKGEREELIAYFEKKGHQLVETVEKPSDHLVSKDFALIFSYSL